MNARALWRVICVEPYDEERWDYVARVEFLGSLDT